MSFSRVVLAAVPSVTHSSLPSVPLEARKYSLPLKTVKSAGKELPAPGLMSLSRMVPAAVPSVTHSSVPLVPLKAKMVQSRVLEAFCQPDSRSALSYPFTVFFYSVLLKNIETALAYLLNVLRCKNFKKYNSA